MLDQFDTSTMIPAKDIQKTRRFYEDVLGFSPVREDPGGIEYKSGSGVFYLYPTQFAGKAEHTLMGWTVDNVDAIVDDLSRRGVTFEQYDMPGLKTDQKGIAGLENGERFAWFKDPEGNILSVGELPK
jgi:catechol 2,3-dioxygenase-like lactoylglutathione lyase family enzyme